MAAANIERFNAVTGAIFASLYESFPVASDLAAEDFREQLQEVPGEEYLQRHETRFFISTILWLAEHGYLSTGSPLSSGTVVQCNLTATTLELLSALPSSLNNKGPSLGDQLVTATKDGVTEKVKALTSELLSKAAAFGVRAATDWVNQ